MNKLKLSWTIAIILTTINLSFILFSIFHTHKNHEKCPISEPHDHSLCIMHQKLNLDSTQIINYDKIKIDYQMSTEKYVDSLRIQRENLMSILHKENLDTLNMQTSIDLIHHYNQIIFNQLVSQYLAIKEILNQDQQDELCAVYCDIFECSHPQKCQLSKKEVTPCSKQKSNCK